MILALLFIVISELSMPQGALGLPDHWLNTSTGLAPGLVTLGSGTIVTSPTNPRLKPDLTVTQGLTMAEKYST